MSDSKNVIEQVNKTFGAFQDAVKENLKSRDALTESKIAKIEADLAEKQTQVDALALAAARGGSAAETKSANDEAVKKTFAKGLRVGFEKLDSAELKSLAVGDRNNADGGFLVPEAVQAGIVRKLFENNPIRSLASHYNTSSSHLEFLQEGVEPGSAWVGEKDPRPETSTPTINSMKIDLFEHYAEPRVTRWILEDAAFDLEAYLSEKVGERFARQQAIAFMNGNGTTRPSGILKTVSTTVSDANTVKAVTTSTVGKILPADLLSLVYDLETGYLDNAVFLMNRAVMASIRGQVDTTGQFIWQPSMQAGQPATLFGYPVYQVEDLAAVATGNDAVIFGDIKRAYAVVDKPGSTIMIRDEITEKQYIKYYTRTRVGGGLIRGEAVRALRIK